MTRRRLLGLSAAGAAVGAMSPTGAEAATDPHGTVVRVDSVRDLVRALAEADGSTIHILRGTYELPPGGLRIRHAKRLVGEGAGTVLRGSGNRLVHIESRDVVLEALILALSVRVTAPQARIVSCDLTPDDGPGLLLDQTAHAFMVQSCNVRAGSADGITIDGARGCVVHGCRLSGQGGAGVALRAGAAHVISSNVFEGWSRGGVSLHGTSETSVSGNTFSDTGIVAVVGRKRSVAVVISGNVVRGGSGSGIALNDCGSTVVADNQVADVNHDGIRLDRCEGCTVVGNSVHGCGLVGIRLTDCAGSTCTGNVCRSNGARSSDERGAGISMRGAQSIVVAGNVCDDPDGAPVQQAGLEVLSGSNVLSAQNVLRGYGRPPLVIRKGVDGTAAGFNVPSKRVDAEVGRRRTTIAHGLGHVPLTLSLQMTSPGRIWQDADSDELNVYLRADAERRSATLLLG